MAKRLFILTLEPIDKRYTKQFYEYWKPAFKKYFKRVEYIDGYVPKAGIEKGRFLDINKTNIWKAKQVEKISLLFYNNKIKDDDIFLFADGWHFGITALKYMAQLSKIKCKIFAYWHAGSWDKWDFVSQAKLGYWCRYTEAGWLRACDGHFVATEFHKKLILLMLNRNRVPFVTSKIKVVGFPMDWKKAITDVLGKKYDTSLKEDIVVFPHRLDKEKNPKTFDTLAYKLKNKEYKFIKTMEVTKNKEEYYKLLCRAKISFSASLQETFGIGTVEAMMLDCIPVVPRRLSYIELYDPIFIYTDWKSAKDKIKYFMWNYNKKSIRKILKENQKKIQTASKSCFKKMADAMLGK